jgi:hypothetical protein
MARKLLVVLAGAVIGFAGLWIFASPVAGLVADITGLPRWFTSIGFVTIWFGAYMLAAWRYSRTRPELRVAAALAFLIPATTTGAVFAYSHLHDTTVHDQLVTADIPASQVAKTATPADEQKVKAMNVQLFSSDFEGIGHSAKGHVRVIKLANGGLRLTLSDVDIENAPDLHLYIAEEKVTGDVGKYKYVARLKGNKGNQQYKLDDNFDLKRYHVVVVWCRAFDVGVAQAPLKES